MSDPTQNPPGQPPGQDPGGQIPGGQPPGEGYSAPPPPYQPPGQQPQGGYQPAPGYGHAPAPGGAGQPADLLMRFLARLIDGILIGVVNLIISSVLIVGILGLNSGGIGSSGGFVAGIVSSIISTAIYLGYFVLLESRNGQTLGKMALKLQVQGPDGGTPTTEQALKRNLWTALGLLGIIPIVGGLIGGLASIAAVIAIAVTINSSPTKQGWHDNFAGGTRVMKIG